MIRTGGGDFRGIGGGPIPTAIGQDVGQSYKVPNLKECTAERFDDGEVDKWRSLTMWRSKKFVIPLVDFSISCADRTLLFKVVATRGSKNLNPNRCMRGYPKLG